MKAGVGESGQGVYIKERRARGQCHRRFVNVQCRLTMGARVSPTDSRGETGALGNPEYSIVNMGSWGRLRMRLEHSVGHIFFGVVGYDF